MPARNNAIWIKMERAVDVGRRWRRPESVRRTDVVSGLRTFSDA
jgi:hypothetical protein